MNKKLTLCSFLVSFLNCLQISVSSVVVDGRSRRREEMEGYRTSDYERPSGSVQTVHGRPFPQYSESGLVVDPTTRVFLSTLDFSLRPHG